MGLYYQIKAHLSSSANVLAFSPSGELLAIGGASYVSLWTTADGYKKYHIDTRASVTSLAWSRLTQLQCGLENGYILSVFLDDGSKVICAPLHTASSDNSLDPPRSWGRGPCVYCIMYLATFQW